MHFRKACRNSRMPPIFLFCAGLLFSGCEAPELFNPGDPTSNEYYLTSILPCVLGTAACSTTTLIQPDTVSNLRLWLEADSLSLSNDGPVTAWPDKTGNSASPTQAMGAQQPLYKAGVVNGHAAVRFEPTATQHLTMSSDYLYSSNDGMTIMAVVRNNSQNASQFILDFGGNSEAGYGLGFSANTNGLGVNALFYTPTTGAVGGLQQFVVRQTEDTEWVVVLGRIKFSPAADKHQSIYLNGTSFYTETAINVVQLTANEICEAASRGGTGTATPLASCSAAGNGGPVTIGAQSRTNSENGRFFDGDIALILWFDRALTENERRTIECYGSRKYGITIAQVCD